MVMKHGLDPVVDCDSRILILGTIPGDESIRLQRYYAHPQNKFWAILSDIYEESIDANYEEFLHRKGLALWDVLRSADRAGSRDSTIKDVVENDFDTLFGKYSGLRAIAFNGTKAQQLFCGCLKSQPCIPHKELRMALLPSTSPTPGCYVLPYKEKVNRWREAFLVL